MAEKETKNVDTATDEKAQATTEVAIPKQESTDLVSTEDDFFAGAGEGLENVSQSDMLIPYVRIIQALSKELQKNHAKFLQGADQGAFVNSATRKLWDGEKGFLAVPVSWAHRYMAWKPNNGGPAYDMGPDGSTYAAAVPNEKGQRFDGDGNQLSDALQFFIMMIDEETHEYEMAVLNFSGSQMKKARGWITTINNRQERKDGALIRPAVYFYSYKFTSTPESNDQGSWYGFSIAEGPKVMELPIGGELFRNAREIYKRISAGEVKADVEGPDGDEEGTTKAF